MDDIFLALCVHSILKLYSLKPAKSIFEWMVLIRINNTIHECSDIRQYPHLHIYSACTSFILYQ